jgi:hypothetical protein
MNADLSSLSNRRQSTLRRIGSICRKHGIPEPTLCFPLTHAREEYELNLSRLALINTCDLPADKRLRCMAHLLAMNAAIADLVELVARPE